MRSEFSRSSTFLSGETTRCDSSRIVDYERIKDATTILLTALGCDITTEGLKDTPRRVADLWREFIEYDPGRINTSFEAVHVDQLVVVSGIKVWSMCEHHLLPFWSDISMGYITDDKVLGLSKLGRIAHKHAHKLQLQERMVNEIAAEIRTLANTASVAVIARGEHLCMASRGIKSPHRMVCSAMYGRFRDETRARTEFLELAGK